VIVPRPSTTGERRAEISGRAKSDRLLRDQEAVCLQLVAGARNHMQPNRSLEFGFEITVRDDEIGAEREFEPVFRIVGPVHDQIRSPPKLLLTGRCFESSPPGSPSDAADFCCSIIHSNPPK
jgi:hypothetical protein